MATHWNSQGEVNGYTSKFWGFFSRLYFFPGFEFIFILRPSLFIAFTAIYSYIEYQNELKKTESQIKT
jgi:hypothetical protein